MYDNGWKTDRKRIRGTGQKFTADITVNDDQDTVIALDYQGKRQLPQGCPQERVYFNIYVVDYAAGGVIA